MPIECCTCGGGATAERQQTGDVTVFWCEVQRDVLRVSGADALTYLQSQISQDIRGLAVGESTYTFVLQPMGKVDALARLTRVADTDFLVDTDAGSGERLTARLVRFKIRVAVEIEPLAWRMIVVRGADSVPAGGIPAWASAGAYDILGAQPTPPDGIAEGSPEQLEAARIAAGWPAMDHEITDATIPAETGVIAFAVNFTKGCYPGQELVERMDSRGSSAPRFVRRLRGAGDAQIGDVVSREGKDVGSLTSVATVDGGWVALALIARAIVAGDSVVIAASSGSVESIVEDATPGTSAAAAKPVAAPIVSRIGFR